MGLVAPDVADRFVRKWHFPHLGSDSYPDIGCKVLIQGEEIVYDFFSMESGRFTFREVQPGTGICLSLVGISASPYFTYIFGFDEEGLLGDWEGQVAAAQVGVEVPIFGLFGPGFGLAGFVSLERDTGVPDWDVYGVDIYADISLGVNSPLWLAGYTIDTSSSNLFYQNYLELADPIGQMERDILAGRASPIMLTTDRTSAALWARIWFEERYRTQ